MNAVDNIGIYERDLFRNALKTTLVKEKQDHPTLTISSRCSSIPPRRQCSTWSMSFRPINSRCSNKHCSR
jgi:hypothetical protein